jgi:hypothetical protein
MMAYEPPVSVTGTGEQKKHAKTPINHTPVYEDA